MSETVYILLGSNLGDREKNLNRTLDRLESLEGLELVAVSGIYVSEAVGMSEADAPSFMNQVVKAEYQFTAAELLGSLELVEKNLGRTGKGKKESRMIDLDILLYGEHVIETETLSIPHRELLNRPFSLVPLLEIDPDIIHPVTGTPAADFLDESAARKVMLYRDHVARTI
ncbi:MAG: 2-amino-4-hydroxy-6-hydroxymethyldihydropteridine diphosphokinase [bacterium]